MTKVLFLISFAVPPVAWLLLAPPVVFAVIGATGVSVAGLVFIWLVVTNAASVRQPVAEPEPVPVEVRPC